METTVLLGAPIFSNDPRVPMRCPIGQHHLYMEIANETKDPRVILRRLYREYISIFATLNQMGISFKIAITRKELMLPGIVDALKSAGAQFIELAGIDPRIIVYPRDLATVLENCGLISTDIPSGYISGFNGPDRIIHSFYGEGGSILTRKNVALITERFFPEKHASDLSRYIQGDVADPTDLTEAGINVGIVPNPVNIEGVGEDCVYSRDYHLDRVGSLIEDRDGGLHLILDPKIQSDYHGPLLPPRLSVEKSLNRYRTTCRALGITVHVPQSLHIPGSVGLIQFANRKVLMTSGERNVSKIVERLVGSENVFYTSVPIRYYPTWGKATIHCLIGEIPAQFLEYLTAQNETLGSS